MSEGMRVRTEQCECLIDLDRTGVLLRLDDPHLFFLGVKNRWIERQSVVEASQFRPFVIEQRRIASFDKRRATAHACMGQAGEVHRPCRPLQGTLVALANDVRWRDHESPAAWFDLAERY